MRGGSNDHDNFATGNHVYSAVTATVATASLQPANIMSAIPLRIFIMLHRSPATWARSPEVQGSDSTNDNDNNNIRHNESNNMTNSNNNTHNTHMRTSHSDNTGKSKTACNKDDS